MFTRTFWEDAFQRAVRTAFQFFLYSIGSVAIGSTIAGWNWASIGGSVAAGFIISIATTVAAPPVTAGTGAHASPAPAPASAVSGRDGSNVGGV